MNRRHAIAILTLAFVFAGSSCRVKRNGSGDRPQAGDAVTTWRRDQYKGLMEKAQELELVGELGKAGQAYDEASGVAPAGSTEAADSARRCLGILFRRRRDSASGGTVEHPSTVLSRIEAYEAPPHPVDGHVNLETYDYRLMGGEPLPRTLTEALVSDLVQRIEMDLKTRKDWARTLAQSDIALAIDVYVQRSPSKIAGFRPWTHWHFIRSLDEQQRAVLAKEVYEYISIHGVKEVDDVPPGEVWYVVPPKAGGPATGQ